MSLLFVDSWDHYAAADKFTKWSGNLATGGDYFVIGSGTGRHGSNSGRFTHASNYSPDPHFKSVSAVGTTCVCQFAWRTTNYPGNAAISNAINIEYWIESNKVWQLRQDTNAQISLQVSPAGLLRVIGPDDTLLGTSAVGVLLNIYCYITIKVVLHATAGSVTVYQNGQQVINVTGIKTMKTGTTGWNNIIIGHNNSVPMSASVYWEYDDLILMDGDGAAPWNDVIPECRVDYRKPTAAGANAGWTTGPTPGGTNYQMVDETAPNGDTDYCASTAAGVKDTYPVEDAPVVGAGLYGVQVNLSAKKVDAGGCTVKPVVRNSTTDTLGPTDGYPTTSYTFLQFPLQTNPGTGVAWTEAGFNAAEFGYQRTL